MKRTLIALALAGLTLGSNVVRADWNDITLEQFFQREGTSVEAAEAVADQGSTQARKYEQVDGYNN
jgi:hypothetical protein